MTILSCSLDEFYKYFNLQDHFYEFMCVWGGVGGSLFTYLSVLYHFLKMTSSNLNVQPW